MDALFISVSARCIKLRTELGKFHEAGRKRFKGVFIRFGEKTGYKGKRETTVLLKEVVDFDSERYVADHLWFTMGKQFERLELKKGGMVRELSPQSIQ